MKSHFTLLKFFLLIASIITGLSTKAQHTLEEVRVYDTTDTWVTGINNSGAIVGYYFDPTVNSYRGFVVPPNGRYRFFYAAPGFDNSQVMAIDNKDSFTVLIRMSNAIGLNEPSKVYKSTYYPLGDTFSTKEEVTGIWPNNPVPTGINTKGMMSGWYAQGASINQPRYFWLYFDDVNYMPSNYSNPYYATRHTIGTTPQPSFGGGINDNNLMCGYYYDLNTTEYSSYLFDINNKSINVFTNMSNVQLQGMNNYNFVVGKRRLSGQTRAFMGTYSGTTLMNITIPIFQGPMTSEFTDVNDHEEIVGNYVHPTTGKSVGFIYRRNRTAYKLPGFDFDKHTFRFGNAVEYNDAINDTVSIWTKNIWNNLDYAIYDPVSNKQIPVTANTFLENYTLFYQSSFSWKGFVSEIDHDSIGYYAQTDPIDSIQYHYVYKDLFLDKYISELDPMFYIIPNQSDTFFTGEFSGYCYGFSYIALQKLFDSLTFKKWFNIPSNADANTYGNDALDIIGAIERTQIKQFDKNIIANYGVMVQNPNINLTPWKGLFRLKNTFNKDFELTEPRELYFFVGETINPNGYKWYWHSVLPYKIKTGTTLPLATPDTIFIYDSNYPKASNKYILMESNRAIMDENPHILKSIDYDTLRFLSFNAPSVKDLPEMNGHPEHSALKSTNVNTEHALMAFSLGKKLDYTLRDAANNTTTISNGIFSFNSDILLPVIKFNVAPALPNAYYLDTSSSVSFTTSNYTSSMMNWNENNDLHSIGIFRNDALPTQFDHGFIQNKFIAYGNEEATTKNLSLRYIQGDQQKNKGVKYLFKNFETMQHDSFLFFSPENYEVKIVRIGGDTIYYDADIYIIDNGALKKLSINLSIAGHTTHHFDPYFEVANGRQLVVYVDNGNTGSYNDTLFIDNVSIQDINTNSNIAIYPNPFDEHMYITINESLGTSFRLTLTDISGKKIKEIPFNTNANRYRLNTQHLSSGTYILQIFNQKGQLIGTEKIVKH